MKKIIYMATAVSLLSGLSYAQIEKADVREEMQFGFKIGLNLSNVYDTKAEDFNTDGKLGLAAGAFLAIPIGKYIGIQPEILYSQKGFRANGSILNNPYSYTRTSTYIDLPLLFALKPSRTITLVAGPQISYLIRQRDSFENTSQEQEFDNSNLRKNTFCFLGGMDINLNHLVLSGRVGWDIQNNNGDGTSSSPRYKNVWYQATVGYRFY
jgi:hypothetical protein